MTTRKKAQRPSKAQAAPGGSLVLEGRLSIVQAAELHRTLSGRLEGAASVQLDGTRVEEIDTAILQLLVSLWRTCDARSIACRWVGVSDALRQSATLIGVAEQLHFPDGDAAQGCHDAAA